MEILLIIGLCLSCLSVGTLAFILWQINKPARKFNKLLRQGKQKEAWEYWDSVNLK